MAVHVTERPPAAMAIEWVDIFRGALRALKEQGTWTREQAPLLREYIYALRQADTAREQAESDPWHTTAQGLQHPHPGFGQHDKAVRRAAQLAQILMLTPEEQAKHQRSRKTAPPDLSKPKAKTKTVAEVAEDEFNELDELAERRRGREGA